MNARAALIAVVLALVLGIGLLFMGRGQSTTTPQQDEMACANKDEEACARRRERMRASCEAGSVTACVDLADAHYTPAYAPKDDRLAAQYFEKACALDSARGCFMLSTLRASGRLGSTDVQSAAHLEEKACALGEAQACTSRAKCLDRADAARGCNERAPQKAREFFARACELEKTSPCEDADRLQREIVGQRSL